MKKTIYLLGACFLLAGCNLPAAVPSSPTGTATPLPATVAASAIPSAVASATITPTSTPSPVPTGAWALQGPGELIVPILLYHHVAVSPINSRYYVPPEKFEEQIKLLHELGYKTISTQLLAKAITEGAELPPHPIILTFDDGNLDNYFNAFPILQKYGFTGTLYVVANYVGVDPFMSADQIKEMAAAGWEIGSHGMRHLDLNALDMVQKRYEIVDSRARLEERLGVPISSFSYPFGLWSPGAVDYARFAGYDSAVGTDNYSFHQNKYNVYSLERREIQSTADLNAFLNYLPWRGDPEFIPINSPE
jgi:peptidoglycan/xylan/chitin deacetylase (PgdA/CDA1 family)